MSRFQEQMLADMDVWFNSDEFAEAVVYNDGISPVSILGVVDYGGATKQQATAATITVKKTDVPAPEYRHTFTISGQVWTIKADKTGVDIEGDNYIWVIGIVRDERVSWRK